ncbi:MAG TPA: acetate--CoA ligase family protein [Streptosporangiaceae bacterium]|nr:acetate--CoA ligase family protein [Streptosporangiaceae bacterium]
MVRGTSAQPAGRRRGAAGTRRGRALRRRGSRDRRPDRAAGRREGLLGQITHKSDIGGVALGLRSAGEVRAAYQRVRAAGEQVRGASIDGVLVTAMRDGGAELLAGVTVDPSFGPVLAVGLGGIWVELLGDTRLRALPADAGEVRLMLGELRGAALLNGARGGVPADLDAVAEAIARIGAVALSLNGSLRALEVNPLWVHGDRVEALDALVVTAPAAPDGTSRTELSA